MRLVQLQHRDGTRHVAVVAEPRLELLAGFASVYELAWAALGAGRPLTSFAAGQPIELSVDYDTVDRGISEWRLLPPIDHPQEPSRCFITGTGLTHTTCAEKRRAMHS